MAKITAVVNMKGGVGKSTSVVALAEILAVRHKRRVLIVDLDPQANASIISAGPEHWNNAREADRTIDAFFDRHLTDEIRQPLKEFLTRGASDVQGAEGIDVACSTPEFRYVERDAIARFVRQGFQIEALQMRLANITRWGLEKISREYDDVIVDCPPGISLFTESSIEIADYLVLPTIPDYVSRLGLLAFRRRALQAVQRRRAGPIPMRVLVSKFDEAMQFHRVEMQHLREEFDCFAAAVPQDQQVARAAEWSPQKRALEAKYGKALPALEAFATELVGLLEQKSGAVAAE